MMTPISININFDSLNEAYGFPKNYRDNTFFDIFDRFLAYAEKYNFKYTLFIIGKDLEHPEIFSRVKEWGNAGHEIANHTWSHPMNLGALKTGDIEGEILKAHEMITSCTGIEPKGFIAPAWATSEKVVSILKKYHYEYDISLFPSVYLYPLILKIALNHIRDKERLLKIINRKDWFYPLYQLTQPFVKSEMVFMPLPTCGRWSCPFWHTIHFIFNRNKTMKMLKKLIQNYQFFYYLLHPADLTGEADITPEYSHSLQRMNYSIRDKKQVMDEVFQILAESGRSIVTMRELALNIRQLQENSIRV